MSENSVRKTKRLLGRAKELALIRQGYEKACAGQPQLTIIEGDGGVGKSALIEEASATLRERGSIVIHGLFDADHSNIPYYSLLNSLNLYFEKEILTNAERQALFKEKLADLLRLNGVTLPRLIPAIGKLLNLQSENSPTAAPTLSEGRERLESSLRQLLFTLSTPHAPLVIIMENLHWADSASRHLLFEVMVSTQPSAICIIASIRDNEITDSHPVNRLLKDLVAKNAQHRRIKLENLRFADIQSLLEERLGAHYSFLDELAKLIATKTLGNPFFTYQFCDALVDAKALTQLDGIWHYDSRIASSLKSTDNVLDLIISRIENLKDEVKAALFLGSVFGNRFSIIDLILVDGRPRLELERILAEATQLGLIRESGRGLFIFAHDRIYEAICRMTSLEERAKTHYRIAMLTLQTTPPNELDKMCYFLARQFKASTQLIRHDEEKYKVASIYLLAARRAKDSLSYDLAGLYVDDALEMIPNLNWNQHAELFHALYMIKAEASAFNGDLATSDEIFKLLLRSVTDKAKKIEIINLAMHIKCSLSQYKESVELGLSGLNLLGVDLKKKPTVIDLLVMFRRVKSLVNSIGIEQLANLPQAQATSVDILTTAIALNAYFYDKRLCLMAALHSCVRTLKDGPTEGSWTALAMYSSVIPAKFGMYKEGFAIGEIAVKGSEHSTDFEKAFTRFLVSTFAQVWSRPLNDSVKSLDETYEFAKKIGTTFIAGVSALNAGVLSVYSGHPLPRVAKRLNDYLTYLEHHKAHHMHDCLLSNMLAIKALRGETLAYASFSTPQLSEEDFLKRLKEFPSPNPLAWYGLKRLWVDVTLQRYQEALAILPTAKIFLDAAPFVYGVCIFHTYSALLYCAVYPQLNPFEKIKARFAIRRSRKKLLKLASYNTENFAALAGLVDGEYHWLKGKSALALDKLKAASSAAQQFGQTEFAAIAEELIGKYLLTQQLSHEANQANPHLALAYQLYETLGATAKTDLMKKTYGTQFLEIQSGKSQLPKSA